MGAPKRRMAVLLVCLLMAARATKRNCVNYRLAIPGVAVAVLIACWRPGPREEHLAVSAPFAEGEVSGAELFVLLMPGTPLSDLVNVQIDPLKPGMTITEARQALGEPLATRTDVDGTYYVFRNPPNVELAHLSGPSSRGGRWANWSVMATSAITSTVFAPRLQELIARAAPVEEIVIHEQRRADLRAFTAEVEGAVLTQLRWYSISGLPE